MQISPMSLQEAQSLSDIDEECNSLEVTKKIFYIAAGFFSIGTELRLISFKNHSSNFKETKDFKLSEIYHIYSIIFLLTYSPF